MNGGLTNNGDGTFTYFPPTNFSGATSLKYRVSDGLAFSNIATVSISVAGTESADFIIGDSNNNLLSGLGGNDVIYGLEGNDTLDGGGDDDVIVATIGDGNDHVDGGLGIDTYDLSATSAQAGVNLHYTIQIGGPPGTSTSADTGGDTLSGIENVIGSSSDDTIVGSDADNVLSGGPGIDFLMGMEGDDTLIGGDGGDFLKGDYFPSGRGPVGDNTLIGGSGDDLMWGGAGVDSYNGGADFDRVSFFDHKATQGAVASLITQTISNDGFGNVETMISIEGLGAGTVYADHFTGDDNANFLAGEFGDTLIANGGNDSIYLGGAPALLDGGDGVDAIDGFFDSTLFPDIDNDGLAELVFANHGVHIDLGANTFVDDGFGRTGIIINVENVSGSVFADTIIGSNRANTLNGFQGDDTLDGASGNDRIDGGPGADHINGGAGADVIIGGTGDDTLDGNAGADVFVFEAASGADTVLQFDANPNGGQDRIDLSRMGITAASFVSNVIVTDLGKDTLVAVGADTILLLGVNGNGQNVISVDDFILAS